MPGPCSAPNGDRNLVNRTPVDDHKIKTGKTALKHKEIKHVRKSRPTRAEVERQNEE